MSVLPPAGHGTVRVTGLGGNERPSAGVAANSSAADRPSPSSFILPLLLRRIISTFPHARPHLVDPSRSDFTAGVAGAGTMGRGIAQVLAQCGARTLLFDAQPGAAQKGKAAIGEALGRLAEKGRLKPAEVDATLGRIELVDSLERLSPCHVVVEAIVEDLGVKREFFRSVEKQVGRDCILASNTSSLSVTAMAAACERPEGVAGYQ